MVNVLSRRRRSLLAQLRTGVLPIAIETGRWRSVPVEERLCVLCTDHKVEDEFHFLFECSAYHAERVDFLSIITRTCLDFNEKSTNEKWIIIMSEHHVNHTGQYLEKIFEIRQNIVYSL